MQAATIVDRLDEAGEIRSGIFEALELHGVDCFDLQRFMKLSALALSYGLPRLPIEPTRLCAVSSSR